MNIRALIVALWSLPAASAAGGDLQHNPFTRPELGSPAPAGGDAPAPATAEPELRATLVAGQNSLANVAGQLLSIGDEADGYRLLAVGEGFADFERDGRRITVMLREPEPQRRKGRR